MPALQRSTAAPMLCLDAEAIVLDATTAWTLAGIGTALLLVVARELRNVPASLRVLMATAFLDMVGLFIVLPILPFYVAHLHEQGASIFGLRPDKGVLTALVVTSYTVAQSLSAPWWGHWSDRHGRRSALLIALFASSAAFLLFGFAESLWLLALSRVVQGAGGGTVGVIQAYVTDAVPPEQRAKALGWLSAATNLGVALGPVIASIAIPLGQFDLWPAAGTQSLGRAAPGVLAAVMCLVNVVFAWRFLPESRETRAGVRPSAIEPSRESSSAPASAPAKPREPRVSTGAALRRVFANPDREALRLLLTYGIAIGAAQGINPTIVFFLDDRYDVNESSVGYYFMYIGSIAVFARMLLLGRLIDRFGESLVSRVGIVTLVLGFSSMPFTHSLPMLAVTAALLPIGMALTFPCLTGQLSKIVPKDERGIYMGLQQTFGGASRLVAPLAYGLAFDGLGIAAPFWLAGGVVAATLLLGAGLVGDRVK